MKIRVADIRYVMYTNDLRSTLQQSSMQQQLQQHPSWEAAVGSRAPDLGPDHQLQQWRSVGGSAILSGAFIFFLVDTS